MSRATVLVLSVSTTSLVFRPFEPVEGERRLDQREGDELYAIGSLDLPFTPGTSQPGG